MTATTYQTVRLSPGKHSSPEKGACVMELASMLAGEPFTDRPVAVCPMIAAVLRGYNDHAGDEAREELRRYAVEALGTRSTAEVEQRRLERCFEVFDEFNGLPRRSLRRPMATYTAWQVRSLGEGPLDRAGRDYLGRALARYLDKLGPSGLARFLALVDELVGMAPRTPADSLADRAESGALSASDS